MEEEFKEFDFTKDEIKLDNSIIERAIGKLNKNPFELFMFICADFSRENLIETPDIYKLTIKNSDFLNSVGYTSDSGYVKIVDYFKELQRTIFEIPIWDKGELAGKEITGLIMNSKIMKKGTTTVWINKTLAPYYYTMKIERDRTITRYNMVRGFKSEYSAKIYFMLIRWRNTNHKKITYEVEELKTNIGKTDKYKSFKEFNRCVLEVARTEINTKTDIIMDYKKLALGESSGKGRKPITHIEFSFKMKNEQQQEELLTEDQIEELLKIAGQRTTGTDKAAIDFYDYAFAETVEGCNNNKGFYKYMKTVLQNDKVFIGQMSMFSNPDVRAAARKKSDEVQKKYIAEKKEKTAKKKAEVEADLEAKIEKEREERLKGFDPSESEITFDFLKDINKKTKG